MDDHEGKLKTSLSHAVLKETKKKTTKARLHSECKCVHELRKNLKIIIVYRLLMIDYYIFCVFF